MRDRKEITKDSHKPPVLTFRPEVSGISSPEFLAQFLEFLKSSEIDPDKVVYSGFDGSILDNGEEYPNRDYIHVMNEAAWRVAGRPDLMYPKNPAQYAGPDNGYIGIYDLDRLAEAYGEDDSPFEIVTWDDVYDEREFTGMAKGDALTRFDPSIPFSGTVVPLQDAQTIADTLVALIKIEHQDAFL